MDAPSQVALFVYNNDTFIIESFLPEDSAVRVITDGRLDGIQGILSGEVISGEELRNRDGNPTGEGAYPLSITPHAYRVFRGMAKTVERRS